jgi:hypothetical protein
LEETGIQGRIGELKTSIAKQPIRMNYEERVRNQCFLSRQFFLFSTKKNVENCGISYLQVKIQLVLLLCWNFFQFCNITKLILKKTLMRRQVRYT